METATPDNQLAIIQNSALVFQNAGDILIANKTRSEKALEVGRNILSAIQVNGMTPEMDERAMKYLANAGKALKEMKEGRAEVTQIMDELKKLYTAVENDLDPKKAGTIPSLVQAQRDAYVKKLAEEKERIRKEAEAAAAKAREEVEIRSHISTWMGQRLLAVISAKKVALTNAFNAITLEDYEAKQAGLRALATGIADTQLSERIGAPTGYPGCRYHDAAESDAITNATYENFDWPKACAQWETEISATRQELLDRLPSKLAELQEQKRLNDEAEEAVRKAAAAKTAAARAAAEQEAKEAEEAKLRAEQERKQREAAEALRMQQEDEAAKRKAEQEAEMAKQADQTMIMFEKEAAIGETVAAPEARQGYDITVTHQAGFVQIFQFWFENEGKNLAIDKLEKTSLGQMKTFVEKHAHKQGRPNIESKFLKYEPSYKAVNRKPGK